MCISKIKALFKKPVTIGIITPPPVTTNTGIQSTQNPTEIPNMTLTHPEEPFNRNQTLENTTIDAVLQQWFDEWQVPIKYQNFWKNQIGIMIGFPDWMGNVTVPAVSWEQDGKRHVAMKLGWVNPGVVAHEQSHNSYALLSNEQKSAFSANYNPLKNTDPLIRYLYSVNPYGLTSDVEGHADVYRYLGNRMPDVLRQYYPKLF